MSGDITVSGGIRSEHFSFSSLSKKLASCLDLGFQQIIWVLIILCSSSYGRSAASVWQKSLLHTHCVVAVDWVTRLAGPCTPRLTSLSPDGPFAAHKITAFRSTTLDLSQLCFSLRSLGLSSVLSCMFFHRLLNIIPSARKR